MPMTLELARALVHKYYLDGARAYALARAPGEIRTSKQIFDAIHSPPEWTRAQSAHGHTNT